jgi:ParB family chromosome partitioning protein
VEADRDDAERLAQMLPGEDIPLVLTHWSFGHLAQELLAGSGWLPEPLRTPGRNLTARALTLETSSNASIASPGEGLASSGYETAMVGIRRSAEDESAAAEPHAVAAE